MKILIPVGSGCIRPALDLRLLTKSNEKIAIDNDMCNAQSSFNFGYNIYGV